MKQSFLENSKIRLKKIVTENRLEDTPVMVLVKTLTPEEAIGEPGRRDYPIILGKERMVEATFLGTRAHAFTDSPGEFIGSLGEIINFPLSSNKGRAIYTATLNAVLKHLNLLEKTIHCRDEDPENCAREIASHLLERWGNVTVGLIGMNPAIAERLVQTFGVNHVRITDLNQQNITSTKFGVTIWDGNTMIEKLVRHSEVILITGTTLVNGTFDSIMELIQIYGKNYLIYGVSGSGVCQLMGLKRICPYGRNS
ncbi:MAG: hypothetical protein A2Y79_01780 [Deltaproteobacteria bacterium RBG_13_43_22]|nr:MAG: hypothetical protein A2Y79_01780 [Deltaproteobacteria bacterium RBG_13_43_22]